VLPDLDRSLRDLPRTGTLVKDRGYRQIWRFEHAGRPYLLKFYPKTGWRDWGRRLFRGSPAMAEFTRLQRLQKAQIPSPRAVASLMGFKLNNVLGDAVIYEAIEPSVPLDQYLREHQLAGKPIPNHLALARDLRQIVQQLGRAGMGHDDLHLGNFFLANGKLYLMDGYAVRTGGLKLDQVLLLGHSAASFANKTDLLRGWYALTPGRALPTGNRVSRRLWANQIERATGENRYFGKFTDGVWTGSYVKRATPQRWSIASRLEFEKKDWDRAWPGLLKQINADTLTVLKRSDSGDVLSGELVIGGKPLPIIVKRPRRKFWYRYVNEIGRGSRPRRAWMKAWRALHSDLPTAQPLLMIERRKLGYVVDGLLVLERVKGDTLETADLNSLSAQDRERLFHRTGRVLRKIEALGWAHFDAKSSNWIVQTDAPGSPYPIMVDIDGLRHRSSPTRGIKRLLRSLLQHPQYTPTDSLNLCRGYAPRSPLLLPKLTEAPAVTEDATRPEK